MVEDIRSDYPDYIPMADGFSLSISARAIIRDKVFHASFSPDEGGAANFHNTMDMDLSDTSIPIIKKIMEARDIAEHNLLNYKGIQEVLKKTEWTDRDRKYWQQALAGEVNRALKQIPELSTYRTSGEYFYDENTGKYEINNGSLFSKLLQPGDQVEELTSLKDISPTKEWDCDKMSAVQASLMQMIEDKNLPASGTGLKKAFPYYISVGISISPSKNEFGGHAMIISSANADTMESTVGHMSYFGHLGGKDYSFQDFVAGIPLALYDRENVGYFVTYSPVHDSELVAKRYVALAQGKELPYSKEPLPREKVVNDFNFAPVLKRSATHAIGMCCHGKTVCSPLPCREG